MHIIQCKATGIRFAELFPFSVCITTDADQTMKYGDGQLDMAAAMVTHLRQQYGSFDWQVVAA